jgi:hypothetical protein
MRLFLANEVCPNAPFLAEVYPFPSITAPIVLAPILLRIATSEGFPH